MCSLVYRFSSLSANIAEKKDGASTTNQKVKLWRDRERERKSERDRERERVRERECERGREKKWEKEIKR